MSAGGVLQGCSYVFQTVVQDYAYKGGELTLLDGSITYWTNDSSAGIGLKLGVGNNDASGKMVFNPPADAFIKTAHGSTARSARVQNASETPGYTMYSIGLDKQTSEVLKDMLDEVPFQVGFNRKKGGMDVYGSVDPQVAGSVKAGSGLQRRRSKEAPQAFLNCMDELLNASRKPSR
ncbi:hypothetical protein LMG32289_03882 [Cupriavidus pampae]|uniref:Uncharacterized protein n=2 Tax=Cupriavidus pampae TaxID=659251 RepID=A0ABN7YWR6_9BURK|nr:hypothetical protein LMG32289_03882 [Cupriavidus pampae]